jgi:hypothetical protein
VASVSQLSRVSCAGALACLIGAGHARPALADEAPTRPEKRESDAKPPSSVRLPSVIGGLSLTLGMWGLNTGTSYLWPDAPGITKLRAPVVGPWMALANDTCPESGCDAFTYINAVYFVVSGLVQAGGLGIALEGLLVPTAAPGERPPAPQPGPVAEPPVDGEPPPPSTAPSTPPAGKPLFYLPVPMTIGQGGVGVSFGGIF